MGRAVFLVLVCTLASCTESSVAEAKEKAPPPKTSIEVDGRVVAPDGPRVLAVPSPTSRPRVSRLDVRIGQSVSEGDALATLEGLTEAMLDLEIAKSELQRAEVEVEWAARPFAPGKETESTDGRSGRVAAANAERRRLRTVAEEKRVAVRRAELRVERLRVRAPISGRILAIHARPGESVDPERGLMTLRPNTRAVRAEVARADLAKVRPGAAVKFTCSAFAKPLPGRILRVEDFVDADRVPVLATFEGKHLLEHFGATGTLRISTRDVDPR